MGAHRRRSWHVTIFPVIVAALGVVALVIGLMFGGLQSGDDTVPAEAQSTPSTPAAVSVTTSAGTATPTASDSPSPAPTASAAPTTTRPVTRRTTQAPRRSATPTPSPTKTGLFADWPTCTMDPRGLVHCEHK